jgi:hypothetical protein
MNPKSDALETEQRFRLISYLLVFLMMACVVMTLSILIRNVFASWHAGVIAGILFFIVIDRLYTYRGLQSLTALSSEWAITIGTQWIVIILFSWFLLSYANGPSALRQDLLLLGRGAIADLFTPEFVVTIFLAFAAWFLPAQFLELLDEIGLDMKFALSEEATQFRHEAIPAHQRLVNLIFSVGIGLVILAALTRINLYPILSDATGLPRVEVNRFSGGEAGALLYFVFGLALLSLSRLMSLQTHWNRLHISVTSHNLVRQWAVYSLFFLLILMVVVSLLPAGDSLGFFSVLGTLLGFFFAVIFFLAQLIVALALLIFSLPFLLFGKVPPLIGFIRLRLPTPPPVQFVSSTPGPIWELIRSILLWGSLAALIIFAFSQFMRQHESVLAALRRSGITNWLILAWQWLYRNADKTRGLLARAIADGWQSIVSRLEGKRVLPHPAWISVRSLDPRRRIYFFYLAMIRRSAEQGLSRESSQTPSEYASKLEKDIPSASEDIDSITAAFVKARYSRHEVNSGEADVVKATWERIRRALQRKAKDAHPTDQ